MCGSYAQLRMSWLALIAVDIAGVINYQSGD